MPVASLPMYDLPEVRPALDALWDELAANLRREGVPCVPETLVHDRPLRQLWSDPDLLLSQCCGYDLVNRYAGKLRPLATPRYSAPGCQGCDYASLVVVSSDGEACDLADLQDKVCVINGPESHSGMNALRALVAPLHRDGRFFGEIKVSGAHSDSLAMIAGGEADVAAIDCVTHRLLARHRPDALAGLRPLCRTASAPGIPFVTRADLPEHLVGRMQTAILRTFEARRLERAFCRLEMTGVELLPPPAYDRITEIELLAAAHGYPRLQ
jgi:ABC-type phosphate/phosphonate transport system substrate-binding protein